MHTKKIKVALVNACTAPIPDVRGGGAERLVTMLLDENEIEQKLDLLVFSKYDKEAKMKAQVYKNSKIEYFNTSNFFDKLKNIFVYATNKLFKKRIIPFGYYRRVASYLKQEDVDIVIDENGYVRDFKLISDIIGANRSAAHIHWQVNPNEREIAHNYGYAMGVSNFITNYWIKNADGIVINATVPSGVNEKRFQTRITDDERTRLRDLIGITKASCVIAYCGRIHQQKGPLELYRAFKKVSTNCPNAVLLFIGGSDKQGSELSEYHKGLLKEASNDKNVFFTGYIENDLLYKYYQISDLLVIPTLVEEAAGLVAIEAMMSGLPIIATKTGGLPEYVNNRCAILVNKDDRMQDELTNALIELINDTEKRIQMAAEAQKQGMIFTQKCYYNNFVEVIGNILQEQRGKSSD